MIKKISEKSKQITIDLTGPDGNAFVLMGYAKTFAKKMGKSVAEQEQIIKDMMSGDYENLVDVFDNYFGSFVILYR